MLIATVALAVVTLTKQAGEAPQPQITVLRAGIGPCSADFTVDDSSGAPIYAATIHVKVRYGFWNIKRADLEVGTNSDGKARIEGLPDKARILHYDIQKAGRKLTVAQDVSASCDADYVISLE